MSSRTRSACATTVSAKPTISCCGTWTAVTRWRRHGWPSNSTFGRSGCCWKTWRGWARCWSRPAWPFTNCPRRAGSCFERRRRRRRTEWLQRLTNVLYIELPLLDPDPAPALLAGPLTLAVHPGVPRCRRFIHAGGPAVHRHPFRSVLGKIAVFPGVLSLSRTCFTSGCAGAGQGGPRARRTA